MENKRKFYADCHDLGFLLAGLDDLQRIHDAFPNFKITCYTIPLPNQFFGENAKHFKMEKYKQWAKIVNGMDWIEIGMHGFSHTHFEMSVTYDKAVELIKAGEKMFEEVGLKYKKMFAAPYWQISYDALVALRDMGYVVAIDRNHPRPIPEGLKTTTYNWSIEEPIPFQFNKIVGHGHVGRSSRTSNDFGLCYNSLITKLTKNDEWGFISEDCVETNWNKEKLQVPDINNLDERV